MNTMDRDTLDGVVCERTVSKLRGRPCGRAGSIWQFNAAPAALCATPPSMQWKFPTSDCEEIAGKDPRHRDRDQRQGIPLSAAGLRFELSSATANDRLLRCIQRRGSRAQFARRWKLSPVCRSGGHSAAGYSVNNEIVIDVSRLNYVVVSPKNRRAIVGAGTTAGSLNAALDTWAASPGRGCDDVGIAGYMLGGGYGFTSQIYGMNCDSVIEAVVMLWDGSIVVASEHCNAIFSGRCAVVLGTISVSYSRSHTNCGIPGRMWGFGIKWHIGQTDGDARRVAAALVILQDQYTGVATPDGLGHQSTFNFIGDERYLVLRGILGAAGGRASGYWRRCFRPKAQTSILIAWATTPNSTDILTPTLRCLSLLPILRRRQTHGTSRRRCRVTNGATSLAFSRTHPTPATSLAWRRTAGR